MKKIVLPLLASSLLTACMNMSGLDAKKDFTCKAPDGVLCESMSGIYANAIKDNLPGQQVNKRKDPVSPAKTAAAGAMTTPIYSGVPIRTAPRILRVWFAPWEDSDGDLHDQSYVYLPVDNGRWLIEHNRRRIQDTYKPVRPPVGAAGQGQNPAASGQQPQAISQPESTEEQVSVGVSQGAMSESQMAEYLKGILKPGELPTGR